MEENMRNSQRIFYQNGFERLKDILTLVFFNPKLQHRTFRHFNPGLFRYEFLNHGVEKFMVEKFMVEKSGVERSGVEAWG